jgi:Secretion system C-terminal sorting domain
MKYLHLMLLLCLVNSVQAQITKKRVFSSYTGGFSDSQPGSITPNVVYSTQSGMAVYAWNQSNQLNITRPFLKWDLSSIPNKSKVLSATLMLYHDPLGPTTGMHQGSNAFYVKRVLGDWSGTALTWANQPVTTNANQVLVPAATSPTQNYCIDVTNLIQDMVNDTINARNGLRLSLLNEIAFTSVVLATSEHPDCTRHPQLLITYEDGMLIAVHEPINDAQFAKYMPNPAHQILHIEARDDMYQGEDLIIRAFNVQGQLLSQYNLTSRSMDINTANLPSGTYQFQIVSKKGNVQSDLILIQH